MLRALQGYILQYLESNRRRAGVAVRLAIVLQEVGTENFGAEGANKVIRMVLFADSIHEGARDGGIAASADGHAFLLQKVNFTVRQTFVIAESRTNRLAASLTGEAGSLLVEETSKRRNSRAFNNLLAGAADLSGSSASLAYSLTIASNILSIFEGLATARAREAIRMPFVTHRIDRYSENTLTATMTKDSSSSKGSNSSRKSGVSWGRKIRFARFESVRRTTKVERFTRFSQPNEPSS